MNYNKLLWSIVGTVVLGIQTGLSDGTFDLVEKIALGAVVLGTVGTWLIPNTPLLNTAKTWVNAISTGTALIATLADNGLTGQEWLTATILVLTTAGVYTIPKETKDSRLRSNPTRPA